MTDLRALLAQAAPAPRAALDVHALMAAADGLSRRRRLMMWLAGALAIGAVGLPGSIVLTSSERGRTRVSVEDTRREIASQTTTTARASALSPPSTVPSRPRSTGPQSTPAGPSRGVAPAAPTSTPPSGSATTATGGGNPDEGCEVTGRSEANVGAGSGGLGVSEYPRCSYTATLDAGYAASGRWEIRIERSGQTLTLSSEDNPPCGSGAVKAGDFVTATLRANTNDPSDWYLRVGPRHRCA